MRCLAFSTDGLTLMSGSDEQTVQLWDVETGLLIKTLDRYKNWVFAVTFGPKGDL